jgi:hypothetical protein
MGAVLLILLSNTQLMIHLPCLLLQDDILLFNVVLAISKVEPETGGWGEGAVGARRRRRLRPPGGHTHQQHGRGGKEVSQSARKVE